VVVVALGISGSVLSGNTAALGAPTPEVHTLAAQFTAQSAASVCKDPPCPPPPPPYARCNIFMDLWTTGPPSGFQDRVHWKTAVRCFTDSGSALTMATIYISMDVYSPLTAPAITDTITRTAIREPTLEVPYDIRYTNPARIWCGDHYSVNRLGVDWPVGWVPINGTDRTLNGPRWDICEFG
jgi:hypothetical protein